MLNQDLKKYVETSGLVNKKRVGDGLFILKYKKKVFFDNLWNSYLEECRGTIVDANFNLVAYPFTKIYNYGIEKSATVLDQDTKVLAYKKVNGFMVACTGHNGDILVSTTGSASGKHVDMAKDMMQLHMPWEEWQLKFSSSGVTVLFECVHPNDPHVIQETPGMYLLGLRENVWDSKVLHSVELLDNLSDYLNCYMPEPVQCTLARLLDLAKTCKHEGFVFYTESGECAKVKSPYYLTQKWIARNPCTDKLADQTNDIKRLLDEEYYPLVDAVRANIVEFTKLSEQDRLTWIRNFLGT